MHRSIGWACGGTKGPKTGEDRKIFPKNYAGSSSSLNLEFGHGWSNFVFKKLKDKPAGQGSTLEVFSHLGRTELEQCRALFKRRGWIFTTVKIEGPMQWAPIRFSEIFPKSRRHSLPFVSWRKAGNLAGACGPKKHHHQGGARSGTRTHNLSLIWRSSPRD